MTQNNIETMKCLESLLNHLPSRQQISYFEFLIIAKQLQLRFQTFTELHHLKHIFETELVTKNRIKEILIFKHKQVQGNIKIQIVGLNPNINQNIDDQKYQQIDIILRKISFLKTYLIQFYGQDQNKWFKAFDLSCRGLVRMYEMRWMLGSIMDQLFTEAQIRILHDSLSTGDGITRDQFVKMFDPVTMQNKIKNNFAKPLKRRANSGILFKQYPFQMIDYLSQHKPPQNKPLKTNPNLRYYGKKQVSKNIKTNIPIKTQIINKTCNSFYSFKPPQKRKLSFCNNVRNQIIFDHQIIKHKSKIMHCATQGAQKVQKYQFFKPDKSFSLISSGKSNRKYRPMSSSTKGY